MIYFYKNQIFVIINFDMEKQVIYIYIDDSGKLSKNEVCFSYGGVYFTKREERDDFKRQFVALINELKLKNKNEDEVKSNNTKPKDKRRILNLMKNKNIVKTHSITIFNKNIDEYVFKSRHTKGRREIYYQKLLIKAIVKNEIKQKNINPKKDLNLIITIDDSKRANNGLYNLLDSVYEELKHGIINFNYSANFPPIIKAELYVNVNYVNSKECALVQAADFVVGSKNASKAFNIQNYKELDVEITL